MIYDRCSSKKVTLYNEIFRRFRSERAAGIAEVPGSILGGDVVVFIQQLNNCVHCDWLMPVIYLSADTRMTSLHGVTRSRDQSS